MSGNQSQKNLFFRPNGAPQHTRPQKNLAHYLFIICCLFLLAGCTTSSTPPQVNVATATAIPSPTPSPTPAVPTGTVLYHTDWSQGLSGWNAPTGVSAQGSKGQLHLTCKDFAKLTLPYQPTVVNYAIETSIQIESTLANAGTFTLNSPQGGGKDGYTVGTAGLETLLPFHGQIEAYINPESDSSLFYAADFSPGAQWITYRIDILDNAATLSINGAHHGQVLSNKTDNLSAGPLTFNCAEITLNMGPLTITAL